MDIYTQTRLEIDFAKGKDITSIVVFEGVEITEATFNKNTHQIEEVINCIEDWESEEYEVYI
jgi:hypothetical protein|tara:strand:- start:623 stop:808 length:186 start_codon:yes stop_codon:yes gene_type:complete